VSLKGMNVAFAHLYRLLAASSEEPFALEVTPEGVELLNAVRRGGRTDDEIRELLATMTAKDLSELHRLRALIVTLLAEDWE
jgi:hypothetical protein